MRGVVSLGLRVLVVVTAAAMGLLLVGTVALAALPRMAGLEGSLVVSGSMAPALRAGGLAFVEPVDGASSIEVGDIITFRVRSLDGLLVSHRVIGAVEDADGLHFITRGDANPVADPWLVDAQDVQGRVRYHLPHVGEVIDTLADQTRARYTLAVGAALLLVLMLARRLRPRPALAAREIGSASEADSLPARAGIGHTGRWPDPR